MNVQVRMSVAKQYERSMLHAFRNAMPYGYVERNTDRVYGNGLSQPSPPDFIALDGHTSFLVECKAVKGQSLPLNRLSEHQATYLHKFARMDHSYGYIAVLFYNGGRGKSQIKRSFLIPAGYWASYASKYSRKSIALKHVANDLRHLECVWQNGGWTLPATLTGGQLGSAITVGIVGGQGIEYPPTAYSATLDPLLSKHKLKISLIDSLEENRKRN